MPEAERSEFAKAAKSLQPLKLASN
jgi:hypothetical protein